MIHAYLFVTHNNKDHDDHGTEFHKHMFRINKQSGSNITVWCLVFKKVFFKILSKYVYLSRILLHLVKPPLSRKLTKKG